MSKVLKNVLLSVLTALFLVTTAVAVTTFNKNYAFAEEQTEQIQQLPAEFSMANGASVRAGNPENGEKDQNGIRFATTITKAFYDGIELKDGQTITFYTLVAKDVASVKDVKFNADGVYTAEWKVGESSWAGQFDKDGKYVRNTELMNFPESMYASVFAARSCYVISDNEDTTDDVIVYADGENSIRSMEGVAIYYLSENAEEYNYLNKYVGLTEDGAINVNKNVGYYGVNKGGLQIDNTGLNGDVRVYNGSKLVSGASFEDGKLTLPASEINGVGNVYTLTDGETLYQQTIKTYDYAIADVSDFNSWLDAFEKSTNSTPLETTDKIINAVLLNDIEFTANDKITTQAGCARGSLDGNGFTVDGLEHNVLGLFASVAKDEGFIFKNIAFTNVVLSKASGNRYFMGEKNYSCVSFNNAFVHIKSAPNATNANSIGIVNDGGTLNVNESVFYFEFTYNMAYDSAFVFRSRDSIHNVKNFYAISNNKLSAKSNSDTLPESEKYSNYARFATVGDYVNAVETVKANIVSGMWDVQDGYFMFASARKYLELKVVTDVAVSETQIHGANRDNLVVDLSAYGTLSSLSSVYVSGADKTASASLANNKLTVAKTAFTVNTTQSLVAVVDDYRFNINVKSVNYAIGSRTELDNFRAKVLNASAGTVYAVVTNDIIMDTNPLSWSIGNYPFTGEFDGQGHTISGLKITATGLFRGLKNGTVKNVAFINVSNAKEGSDTSLFTWDGNSGTSYLTDVYIQGTFASRTKTNNLAGLAWGLGGMIVNNVIIDVEYDANDTVAHYAISGQSSDANAFGKGSNNVFAFSKTAAGFIRPDNTTSRIPSSMTNYGLFADGVALKNAGKDVSSFSSLYWDTTAGYPVWKTAKV